MGKAPSPKGRNGGRGPDGRFRKGWKGGPGNPLASKVQRLRQAMYEAVGPADLKKIIKAMVRKAAGGDTASALVVLRWCVGEPQAADLIVEVEALRSQLEEVQYGYPADGQRSCG